MHHRKECEIFGRRCYCCKKPRGKSRLLKLMVLKCCYKSKHESLLCISRKRWICLRIFSATPSVNKSSKDLNLVMKKLKLVLALAKAINVKQFRQKIFNGLQKHGLSADHISLHSLALLIFQHCKWLWDSFYYFLGWRCFNTLWSKATTRTAF